MLTKTLSTRLYSACTSIDITMGSDIDITNCLTGITPILFSCIFCFSMFCFPRASYYK